MRYCTQCGAKLSDSARFCSKCGYRVAKETEEIKHEESTEAFEPEYESEEAEGYSSYNETDGQSIPEEYIDEEYGEYDYPEQEEYHDPPETAAYENGREVCRKKSAPRIKVKPVVLSCAALAVIITVIILLMNSRHYQEIDAKELFEFSYSGLNGFGTADGDLAAYSESIYGTVDDYSAQKEITAEDEKIRVLTDEYEKLYNNGEKKKVAPYFAIDDKTFLGAWSEAKNRKEAAEMRSALLAVKVGGESYVDCEIEKNSGLKNGDVLNVKVVYDEDYLKDHRIKLTNTEFTVSVSGLDSGTEIDPFDSSIIGTEFSGINGKGSFSYRLFSVPEGFSYSSDDLEARDLSNGDTVSVTFEYTQSDLYNAGESFYFERDGKYYIIPSKQKTMEYTVFGLGDIQEIDPFEGLDFEYRDAAPYLTISRIKTDGCDELIKECVRYSLENNTDLDVGDTFTVKAADMWDALGSKGYKLAGEKDEDGFVSKEFTVYQGVPAYVTSENGIEAYEAFGEKKDNVLTSIRSKFSSGSKFIGGISMGGRFVSVLNIELVDIYVGNNDKNRLESIGWGEYRNRIMGLYRIDVRTVDDRRRLMNDTVYAVVYGDDIIFNGEQFETDKVYLNSKFFRTINDFRDEMVLIEGYTVTKCGAPSEADLIVP